jgi:hypothetical protein
MPICSATGNQRRVTLCVEILFCLGVVVVCLGVTGLLMWIEIIGVLDFAFPLDGERENLVESWYLISGAVSLAFLFSTAVWFYVHTQKDIAQSLRQKLGRLSCSLGASLVIALIAMFGTAFIDVSVVQTIVLLETKVTI